MFRALATAVFRQASRLLLELRETRALRRACGQGAVLSLCVVRPGSGRFGVGFCGWDSGWDCARGIFPPREYSPGSRTPLIIRTVDQCLHTEGEIQRAS